ncbi:MAG: HAD family phosphatase [Candidatus Diapherotrites archaeon]
MVKAIMFDIGGVLVERPSRKRLDLFSKEFKLNEEQKEEAAKAYKALEKKWMKGLITEKELISGILKRIGVKAKAKIVWKKYFKKAYKEKKEVIAIAKALKKAGYKLAVLSNASKPDVEYLKERGFMKLFDYAFFSCDLKCAKPEKRIYLKVLKDIKVKAKDVIFIDDLKENVAAARRVGIKAIVYEDPDKLKRELRIAGIYF